MHAMQHRLASIPGDFAIKGLVPLAALPVFLVPLPLFHAGINIS